MDFSEINYYNILGVSTVASQAEIKSAYRRGMKIVHPDISGQPDIWAKMLAEAYNTLIDIEKRRAYDEQLKNKTAHTQFSRKIMPNLMGKTIMQAGCILAYNQIQYRVVYDITTIPNNDNVVLMQSPEPDSLLKNEPVLLTIGLFCFAPPALNEIEQKEWLEVAVEYGKCRPSKEEDGVVFVRIQSIYQVAKSKKGFKAWVQYLDGSVEDAWFQGVEAHVRDVWFLVRGFIRVKEESHSRDHLHVSSIIKAFDSQTHIATSKNTNRKTSINKVVKIGCGALALLILIPFLLALVALSLITSSPVQISKSQLAAEAAVRLAITKCASITTFSQTGCPNVDTSYVNNDSGDVYSNIKWHIQWNVASAVSKTSSGGGFIVAGHTSMSDTYVDNFSVNGGNCIAANCSFSQQGADGPTIYLYQYRVTLVNKIWTPVLISSSVAGY